MTRTGRLTALIIQMFDEPELTLLLVERLGDGRDILNDIPAGLPFRQLASAIVEQCERRLYMVDLLASLIEARPRWREKIEEIAIDYDIPLPEDPLPPPPPLPDPVEIASATGPNVTEPAPPSQPAPAPVQVAPDAEAPRTPYNDYRSALARRLRAEVAIESWFVRPEVRYRDTDEKLTEGEDVLDDLISDRADIRVLLSAEAGFGKTSILQWAACQLAEADRRAPLPVLVTLKGPPVGRKPSAMRNALKEQIAESILLEADFPMDEVEAHVLWTENPTRLFLDLGDAHTWGDDGDDSVDPVATLFKALDMLARQHRLTYCIAGRPQIEDKATRQIRRLRRGEILPLTQEKVLALLVKKMKSESSAQGFMRNVYGNAEKYGRLLTLLEVPLYLSAIGEIISHGSRPKIQWDMIPPALLLKWLVEHRLRNEDLSDEEHINVLRLIAVYLAESGRSATRESLLSWLSSQTGHSKADRWRALRRLSRAGLVIDRDGPVRFSHSEFGLYFLAKDIAEKLRQGRQEAPEDAGQGREHRYHVSGLLDRLSKRWTPRRTLLFEDDLRMFLALACRYPQAFPLAFGLFEHDERQAAREIFMRLRPSLSLAQEARCLNNLLDNGALANQFVDDLESRYHQMSIDFAVMLLAWLTLLYFGLEITGLLPFAQTEARRQLVRLAESQVLLPRLGAIDGWLLLWIVLPILSGLLFEAVRCFYHRHVHTTGIRPIAVTLSLLYTPRAKEVLGRMKRGAGRFYAVPGLAGALNLQEMLPAGPTAPSADGPQRRKETLIAIVEAVPYIMKLLFGVSLLSLAYVVTEFVAGAVPELIEAIRYLWSTRSFY